MTKRVLSLLGLVLLIGGVLLLAWPAYCYVYSAVNQALLMRQAQQADDPAAREPDVEYELDDPVLEALSPWDVGEWPEVPRTEPDLEVDDGPFIIEIPKIKVRAAVVDGVELADLAIGPGFYPHSSRPGQSGNVCVAAHRTTYGAWFRNVDRLEPGDEILFTSLVATYRYIIESVFPVAKDAWEVVDPTPEPKLTLTTCHPPGSDRQRLVVRAGYAGKRSSDYDNFIM